jgi:hypothetical protein
MVGVVMEQQVMNIGLADVEPEHAQQKVDIMER